jgi:hypothetical protein
MDVRLIGLHWAANHKNGRYNSLKLIASAIMIAKAFIAHYLNAVVLAVTGRSLQISSFAGNPYQWADFFAVVFFSARSRQKYKEYENYMF